MSISFWRITVVLSATIACAGMGLAQEAASVINVDATHTLSPDGLAWVLKDTASGKDRTLLLPAFHPDHSHPLLVGDRLAYASMTKRGDKSQLGCITFDVSKGKVLNRKDTDIYLDESATPQFSVQQDAESGHITCQLAGQKCTGAHQENCTSGQEAVNLSFTPGEQAREGLRSASGRKSAHGKSRRGAKGGSSKGKAGKSRHGAHSSATHNSGRHIAAKTSAKSKASKTTSHRKGRKS